MKSKTVRANRAPYMAKALREAIMRRSYLEGKYYKTGDPEMGRLYRKQSNFCTRLYKKERKKYYTRFWKTMKPFLTGKGINSDKITLIENDNILDEDGEVAEILNNFFSDAPKTLVLWKIHTF